MTPDTDTVTPDVRDLVAQLTERVELLERTLAEHGLYPPGTERTYAWKQLPPSEE